MDNAGYQKIIDKKMKDMEMSPSKRKGMSVENMIQADHTRVSIRDIRRKLRSASASQGVDASSTEEENLSNEEIDVKLIRNKDRSTDASDPVGERTIIFNKSGDILGSQG